MTSMQPISTTPSRPLAKPKRKDNRNPIDKAKGYEVDWPHVSPLFDVARTFDPASVISYVYVIGEEDDGLVKIGLAKDPVLRLRGMQTGNPRRLRIERVVVGDINVEKLLHEIWASFAIYSSATRDKPHALPNTEWFQAEVREQLLPIMATASAMQIKYVAESNDDKTAGDMARIVREAHGAHGYVARVTGQPKFLGPGGGYITPRKTRI